ncbi:carboxymuconolactone decarboxylase family protein [Paludisphaera rhizosphaerae]|uniref:carboxymuconolactone decarboxylase family protein n=1 Tax=Paludisphaera rhizosphaerae TaxID=2711216 RepID=UPI0013EAA047|nr:carboxymuconolactone decarboxylase family protein [Paludisphaera rhizosphaerae]
MERITPVDPQAVEGKAKDLLDAVKAKLGLVPNMTRAMAVSPSVLEAYLGFSGALGHGVLPPRVRERLALGVGEANHCDYCLSAHSLLGKKAGLTEDDVLESRRGESADPKVDALLKFARTIVAKRGVVDDADVAAVRDAGYGDAEIAEIVAHVALNVFTNYFNNVAGTTIDFPKAPALPA